LVIATEHEIQNTLFNQSKTSVHTNMVEKRYEGNICGERMPNKPAPVNKSSPMYAGSVMQSAQMSWWWSMR